MPPPLPAVGITDLFERDPRPTFIVELSSNASDNAPSIIYTSPSMSEHSSLSSIATTSKESHTKLWTWIASTRAGADSAHSSMPYMGFWWTRVELMSRYVVIAANDPPIFESALKSISEVKQTEKRPERSSNHDQRPLPSHSSHNSKPLTAKANDELDTTARRSSSGSQWDEADGMLETEPFLNVIQSVDWASTPLGPMEQWPSRLQQTVAQILADSRPMSLYWGSKYTTIYNEAFSRLCGSRHPRILGQSIDVAFPDTGEHLIETMRTSARKQKASVEHEWKSFIEKPDGSLEETYLKWSIIPVIESGKCLGFMHPVLETSTMRLWERRMKMLIDLGDVLVTARDVKSYWQKTIAELGRVEPRYDIPLAILYSVQDDPNASECSGSHPCNKICNLEGALGVPANHPISPDKLVLRQADCALSKIMREAVKATSPMLLETKNGTLPEHLLKGLEWRGFGDPCRAAVICPIRPTKEEDTMGLLLLGLNPRRNFDTGYQQYLELLAQKLTTTLASTVLLEEEARRGRNAAEQAEFDREELKERLAVQTKEATESIQKFQTVAEFVPVGMSFGDLQGNINFANDAWYRITGYPYDHGVADAGAFLACVIEEDRASITDAYEKLKTTRNVTFEFRVKRQARTDNNSASPTRESPSFEKAGLDLVGIDATSPEKHILASARAERAADGSIIRVLTCLTDVTLHKRTAEEAVRRAQQAENLKRMAEYATVGMYDMDVGGRLLGANNVFFEMCGLDRVDLSQVVVKPWDKCVAQEDQGLLKRILNKLVTEGRPQTAELRFNTPWNALDSAGNKINAPRWVDATFLPVKNPEGVVQSFTGCLSDVSLQKWQLESERQRKEEAIESKRQQENFIDMTSHEMRNPLSAIIHCADAVIASLSKVQELSQARLSRRGSLTPATAPNAITPASAGPDPDSAEARSKEDELIISSIDSTETIIACTQHQRRVVDDILTMSKFDAHLLTMTPITCDPRLIAEEAIKMFDVEARRVDINLDMIVDQSYRDLDIEFLDFDPSRVKQILINLLTNALKFTKSGAIRNVSVTLSTSKERPTAATSSVEFISPPNSSETSPVVSPEPQPERTDPPVYLLFEVRDTGQGLTEDEIKSLFQRFVQASSRTHVKYGGSGLGLFISRRLTEMQGGAIGVSSRPGVGSTFAFYIETFRPEPAALKEAQAAAAATRSVLAAVTNSVSAAGADGRGGAKDVGLGTAISASTQQASVDIPKIDGILVVEDNLINQQITRKGLLDRGYTVHVANHGLEALEALSLSDRSPRPSGDEPAGFPLSLILMDIEMPVQDGLTCTRHIRQLEREGKLLLPEGRGGTAGRGRRIPIIAVSANARMEQILEARAAGCDDVLVKPYRMPELIEKMQVVMRRVWEGGGEVEEETKDP